MSVINILDPHLADMIAAGEVVERPASVVKELVENAFDAGAHNVTVEIRQGGVGLIRVSDDGCGMTPEDAGVAFLRHATSKLKEEKDLEAIGTMGFRGEALAAISAVSEIELLTRRPQDAEGTRVLVSASDIQDMFAAGCPAGTVISVKNLFFNTPARRKFLKTDRSEASACRTAALRCALARPDVSVRFISDGREDFFSPGDGRTDSCIYALLGRDASASMITCEGSSGGVSVHGSISAPSAVRGNRSQQFFFCNGRFIRSQILQTALEQAYKNSLLVGHYPSCVIYVELDLNAVDVNVHPTKTEVKFTDEKAVFSCLYYAALSALSGGMPASPHASAPVSPAQKTEPVSSARSIITPVTNPAAAAEKKADLRSVSVSSSSDYSSAPKKNGDFFRSMSAEEYRNSTAAGRPLSSDSIPASAISSTRYSPAPAEKPNLEKSFNSTGPKAESPVIQPITDTLFEQKPVEKPVENVEKILLPNHKIVGEVLKTYIIVELEGNVLLIDKHAAHERMIFDRLKSHAAPITSQMLLLPVTIRLDESDAELLEQNLSLLTAFGFEISPFGIGSYVIRSVPSDLDPAAAGAAIDEILDKLKLGHTPSPEEAADEILHTVACKAAIKAGWDTDRRELERLVEEVLSGRVKYCPHGRPVSCTITQKELEKMFRRIV
ncbi:MAG: DNA mismatch repair endonuclease MutL [Oscillospiraceae bacterium]|nr:DNA mismatch repair endonuclease MutL [Oscillospiraceae bacterium]